MELSDCNDFQNGLPVGPWYIRFKTLGIWIGKQKVHIEDFRDDMDFIAFNDEGCSLSYWKFRFMTEEEMTGNPRRQDLRIPGNLLDKIYRTDGNEVMNDAPTIFAFVLSTAQREMYDKMPGITARSRNPKGSATTFPSIITVQINPRRVEVLDGNQCILHIGTYKEIMRDYGAHIEAAANRSYKMENKLPEDQDVEMIEVRKVKFLASGLGKYKLHKLVFTGPKGKHVDAVGNEVEFEANENEDDATDSADQPGPSQPAKSRRGAKKAVEEEKEKEVVDNAPQVVEVLGEPMDDDYEEEF